MSITIKVHCHPHLLSLVSDKAPWYCDSLTLGNSCQRKQTEIMQVWPYKRYFCQAGCNFALCDMCAFFHRIDEKPEIWVETLVHDHSLKFFKNIPVAWYCDLVHDKKSCAGNHKNSFEYRDGNVYICSKCEFYLCGEDAALYNKNNEKAIKPPSISKIEENSGSIKIKTDNFERKIKSNTFDKGRNLENGSSKIKSNNLENGSSKIKSNNLENGSSKIKSNNSDTGISQLKLTQPPKDKNMDQKEEQKNSENSVLINFHPHRLVIKHENTRWFCDSLTNKKNCQRTQTLSNKIWPRYHCVEGCDFCVCDWCAYEYKVPEDPKILIETSAHKHPLQFFDSVSIEWYCDMVETDKGCLSNHQKVMDYRYQNVFICKKCNFFMCAADAEKYRLANNSSKSKIKSDLSNNSQNYSDKQNYNSNRLASQESTSSKLIIDQNDKTFGLNDCSYLIKNYGKNLKLIGQGSFGKVFSAEKSPDKIVAVKVVETFDKEHFNESIKELENLARLKGNPNIISYEKYNLNPIIISDNSLLYQIFFEIDYAEENLAKIIKESPQERISQKKLLKILKQIGNGLNFAHERECVHLDLKPENILRVDSVYKIADWGGSLILKNGEKGVTKEENVYITYYYSSPELNEQLENKTFGTTKINLYKCDIYSFGLTILRCCGVKMKYIKTIPRNLKAEHDETIKEIIENFVSKKYSEEFCKLIIKTCKFNPKSRPTISEFLEKINAIE